MMSPRIKPFIAIVIITAGIIFTLGGGVMIGKGT